MGDPERINTIITCGGACAGAGRKATDERPRKPTMASRERTHPGLEAGSAIVAETSDVER
jgi:hypothetical protein